MPIKEAKTPIILLRDWIRTHGDLAEDGSFIVYSTLELEEAIGISLQIETSLHQNYESSLETNKALCNRLKSAIELTKFD